MPRTKTTKISGRKLQAALDKRGVRKFTYAEMLDVGDYTFKNAIDRDQIATKVLDKMSTFSKEKYRITYEEIKPEEITQEPEPQTTPTPQNTDDHQFTQPSKRAYLNVENPGEPTEVLTRAKVIELARTSAVDIITALLLPISEEPPRETIFANQIKRLVKAAFIEALEEDGNRGKYND